MKKLLLIVWMFALVGGLVWGRGKTEEAAQETSKIKIYFGQMTNITEHGFYKAVIKPFNEEFPNVEIVWVPIDATGATTATMDMRIAAGSPIHVYQDYYSRAGKYVIKQTDDPSQKLYALDLAKYWDAEEIDDYVDGALDPYWIDGQLLGVVGPTMLVGMQVNRTVLAKAGYELPAIEDWTIDEFIRMSKKVKAANIPDTFATLLFAASKSGDWMYMGWFSAFGFKTLFNEDYTKSAVNTPAGLRVFEWFKFLLDEGYAPEEAAILCDDDSIYGRDAGLLAGQGNRARYYNDPVKMQSRIDSGLIEEAYDSVFYPYPKAAGVDKAPLVASYNVTVGFGSEDEEINKIVARLVWHMTNTYAQTIEVHGIEVGGELRGRTLTFPARKSVPSVEDTPELSWWRDVRDLATDQGLLDVGGGLTVYNDIRAALFPALQKLFRGTVTPEEALVLYEFKLNKVLDELNAAK